MPKPGLQVPIKQYYYAELITPREGDAPCSAEAVDARIFDIPVRVASAKRLIQMKQRAVAAEEAQKDKHLKDIQRRENAVLTRSSGRQFSAVRFTVALIANVGQRES